MDRVLRKTHTLEGFDLKVAPYYDFLGTKISNDGPTPRVPQPVIVDVDPIIADYIFNENDVESRLRRKMKKVASKIEWPYDQNENKIKLCPNDTGDKDSGFWTSWKENAVHQLTDFFDQYSTRKIKVDHSFWDDICDHLKQHSSKSVRPILRSNEGVIVLNGESREIGRLETVIKARLDELEEAAERERQTVTQQFNFNSENFKLFDLCRIKEEIEQRWTNVNFTLNQSSMTVECKGMQSEVLQAQVDIANKLNNLSKRSIDVSRSKSNFVSLTEDKIHEIFNARNIQAACSSDGPRITVTGKTDTDRDRALRYIETDLVEKQVAIENETTLTILQESKGRDLFDRLNGRKSVLVSLNASNSHVEITGFETDVNTAVRVVEDFIKDNVILEQVVGAEKGKVRFVAEHKGEELKVISGNNLHNSVTIRSQIEGHQSRFIITGTQQGTVAAKQAVQTLIDNTVHQQYSVGKVGMPQLLRENKGQRFLKSVEKDCKCIIETDQEFDSDETNGKRRVPQQVKILRKHAIEGNCSLVVCKGDLTTERVDAIVNAANVDLQHDGGVAGAIVNRGKLERVDYSKKNYRSLIAL